MERESVFSVILLLGVIECGKLCLRCRGIPDPSECTRVSLCGDHEECYMQKYVTHEGLVKYDVGCMSRYSCEALPEQTKRHTDGRAIVCESCCNNTDVCNHGGLCGSNRLELHNGTLCFACDQQNEPDGCDKIKLCSADRDCYIGLMRDDTTSRYHWTTGCELRDKECEVLSHFPYSPYCSSCCKGHLCNNKCERLSTSTTDVTSLSANSETVFPLSGSTHVPSLLPQQGSECTDKDDFCHLLTTFCKDKINVQEKCMKTCGLCPKPCNDSDEFCPLLVSQCQLNEDVRNRCRKSCDQCPGVSGIGTNHHPSTMSLPTTSNVVFSSKSSSPSTIYHSTSTSTTTISASTTLVPATSTSSKRPTLVTITTPVKDGSSENKPTLALSSTHRISSRLTTDDITTVSVMTSVSSSTASGLFCVDDPDVDCSRYMYHTICPPDSIYHAWTTQHCNLTCGFCSAGTPRPCVDELTNCDEYQSDVCTNLNFRIFVQKNCRKYCNLCNV